MMLALMPNRSNTCTRNLDGTTLRSTFDNAIRATKEHDTIAIGAAADGDQMRIWVRDTGPGVELEHRDRIFDRFARGPDEPRGDGGTGLGLAIVRAVAEAHRGRIELDSTALGSTFTLVLPLSVRETVPA